MRVLRVFEHIWAYGRTLMKRRVFDVLSLPQLRRMREGQRHQGNEMPSLRHDAGARAFRLCEMRMADASSAGSIGKRMG